MSIFNVLKASNGGIGQREALRRLRAAGIKCKPRESVYHFHSAVEVQSDARRVVARASRILYGSIK